MTPPQKANPFKGLYSYEEKDKNKFYGRDQEINQLFRLVKLNMLTVVFGNSGIGKTSLIHAGLFPRLRREMFLPIPIRLDYSPSAPPLMTQITQKIQNELANAHLQEMEKRKNELTDTFREGETLWEYFHRIDHFEPSGKRVTPVLVLDQFEEFFTIAKNHPQRDVLFDELYFLVEDQIPYSLREKFKKTGEIFPYINEQAAVRVVLGLRENYLPQLHLLKQQIPSIDRVMFQVPHLNGLQAREIMEKAEGFGEEKTYGDVLRNFYPESTSGNVIIPPEKLEVEPFLLSLLCYRMFETGVKRLSRKEKDAILSDFYDEELNKLSRSKELAEFIETRLLTEGGFRTPFFLDRDHPLREPIEKAINRKILRRVYYGEKEHVKIIHDVLTPVIKERRSRRLEEERKQEFQEKLHQRQKLFRIVSIAGLISLFLAIMFFLQKNRADWQYKEAASNRLAVESSFMLPEDNIKAVRIAEAAYKISMPNPSPTVQQLLSTTAYSTFNRPFYSESIGYEDKVSSAIFTPDGIKILTISMNGTAKVWNQDKKLLIDLSKHKVTNGIFSPDGTKIITLSRDNIARLWSLNGELLATLDKHTAKIWNAFFSSDGTKIVTTSDDNTAKLWDLKGNLLADLNKHTAYVSNAVFSPDGSKLLTASWDNTAKLWDLKGNVLAELKHNDNVWSAAFSPDKIGRIVTASSDKTMRMWDLKGTLLKEWIQTDKTWCAVFSPDGGKILSVSGNAVKLRDLATDNSIDLGDLSNPLNSPPAFSPDGQRILTWMGTTARLWDLNGKPIADLDNDTDLVSKATFPPDCSKIITWAGSTVKLWNLKDQLLIDLNKFPDRINNALISPDGTKIIRWSGNNAQLWDLKGSLLAHFDKHTAPILTAAFSPNGSTIITGSWDHTAKLWDLNGKLLTDLDMEQAQVTSTAFSPDGTKVLTASRYYTAQLWDLNGNRLTELKINMDNVENVILSPDGTKMLTWSSQGNISKLWDLNGNILAELKKHTSYINTATFSPDNTKIVTASNDKSAILWDLKGNPLAEMKKHMDSVTVVTFSPDGNRILTASKDNTAKLWDLKGNLLADLNKHTDDVLAAAFSDKGKQIITVSKDGTVKQWYTLEAIMEWLKTARIPKLSEEDKKILGIEKFNIK